MIHEYGHQSEAKKLLGKGDFVYFKDLKDRGRADIENVNSGIVSYVDDTNIDIDDVNGDGDNITRRLDEIVLCYDSEWDSEEDDRPAAEPMRCPVCKSEKKRQPLVIDKETANPNIWLHYDYGKILSVCPDCRAVFLKGVDE